MVQDTTSGRAKTTLWSLIERSVITTNQWILVELFVSTLIKCRLTSVYAALSRVASSDFMKFGLMAKYMMVVAVNAKMPTKDLFIVKR